MASRSANAGPSPSRRRPAPSPGESMPLVTLTSDFGEGSPYVAAMKAVLLTGSPAATLVDVSHSVPPFDILSGAFVLWAGVRLFAPGAVHLAVVDPGLKAPVARVRIGETQVDLVVRTVSDAPPATPFLYVGSMGFVGVGVREGSAAALLGVEAGAPVEPVVTS